jgi:hypothetical protein
MDVEVRPEPTDDERQAILAALDPTRTDQPAADNSSWRRAALDEAVEGEGLRA